MSEPRASRPYMPGYGTLPPEEGTGLLGWAWAEERLTASRSYWFVSLSPDGRPHAMPVWGVWHDGGFWFASSVGSRKTRNLLADPRCTVTSENATQPVVVEGLAELVTERELLARYLALENAKYGTDIPLEFIDPATNATFRIRPLRAFGLVEDDFTGSPTRWIFGR